MRNCLCTLRVGLAILAVGVLLLPAGARSTPPNDTLTNCTYTQGFWKNHSGAWPVTSLMLGTVSYTRAEILQIYGEPVAGNGLIKLAHQLSAAKLNIAQGASVPAAVAQAILDADALIGGLVVPPIGTGSLSSASVDDLNTTLTLYNEGVIGPGHCGPVPTQVLTWGGVKARYTS